MPAPPPPLPMPMLPPPPSTQTPTFFSQSVLAGFVGECGNFSVQYNLSCLGIALAFAGSHATSTAKGLAPDLPQPAWAKYTLLGAVFAGTIVGMVALGYVGDVFGRRAGMLASLSLVVAGTLASALLSWGPPDAAYGVVAFCRLVIGIGVGGLYPNSAAISAESTAEGEDDGERVAWGFFWQSPGSIAPYALGWVLLAAIPASTPAVTSLQFRILLAAGAIPAGAVLLASFWLARDEPQQRQGLKGEEANAVSPQSALALAIARPELMRALVGTAGTWLLYDVSYYGTAIFTPQILDSIFGGEAALVDLCWQAIVKEIAGLAGVLAAIAVMRRLGGRGLCLWGFLLLAVLFSAFGLLYQLAPGASSALKFVVYCALTFALNWGPNVSTYVLPAQLFPREVRTSFHGISAASGKVGAVIGTFIFAPIANSAGIAAIMWVQVGLCLLGALLTYALIPDNAVPDAPVLWCGRLLGCGGRSKARRGKRSKRAAAAGVGEVVANPLGLDALVVAAEPESAASRRERMRSAGATSR